MAGKRARAQKKRADYRKGGRVHAEQGWNPNDITRMVGGMYDKAKNKASLALGQERNMYSGPPVDRGAPVYDRGAPKEYSPWDDINSGGGVNTTSTDPTADANRTTGSVYNAAGADLNRVAMFDNTVKPIGVQETFNPDAVEAENTTTTTTPAYTQADIDQAVADLNSGKITAAQLAAQYGVSEDYVNQNLKAINTQAAAAETATTDTTTTDTTTTGTAIDPDDGFISFPRDDFTATTTTAADVADIPVDGSYTEFETEQVVEAINSGAMTVKEVADTFGATEAQVQAELDRQNQKAAGEEVTGTDPFSEGVKDATKELVGKQEAAKSQEAIKETIKDTGFKNKPVNFDTESLKSQILALDEQLKARGLTPDTPEYIAAQEQARAEFVKLAQGTGQVNFSIEEFAAATGLTVAQAQNQYYNYNHEGKVPLGLSYKNNVTKAQEETYVPGSYLRNYKPVDKQKLIQQQTAEGISREGTTTSEEAIQQLNTFSGIDYSGMDKAVAKDIEETIGTLKEAVNDGTVSPEDYEAELARSLGDIIPAFKGAPVEAVMEEIRALTDPAVAAQVAEQEAASRRAKGVDYIIDPKSFISKVTGETAVLSESPEAEFATRSAITGKPATPREAAQIDQIGYEARQRAKVTGEAAKGAAANAVVAIGNIPAELAEQTIEDAASVSERIDTEDIDVQAAVAALPPELLVSAQMENLLGGMESGNIPTWAKPAVSAVEQGLAARGLGVSTVGRDALFNAIIQTALPMAQSNAQALQTRATNNLNREQQANLEEARLNATRRLSNLSNQQTASSQTAQFAQNINVLETQQRQQTALTSAQLIQQTELQNLQNRQRTAELESQNRQQINSQELGNAQQIELAELEIKNQTEQQNMTADNQMRLANMQVAADFLSKNAGFKQQMELANLSNEQQMELANLSAQNQANAESLTNEQQALMADLNATMQSNLAQGRIAAEMNVAQLNVDQQRAVTNATKQANIDLTKFSTAQQVELANSQFMQNTTLTNMNARQQAAMQRATSMASLDLSAADSRTKLSIENARNFLQLDVTNLNNEQQASVLDAQMEQQRLLADQAAENVALQFGATSTNQVNMFLKSQKDTMEQFNATQSNAMEQFNASEKNRIAAIEANNSLDASKFNAQVELQVEQFNKNIDNQRDIWNASNAQAIEQANTNWRRQANTADTAAINAANAQNVQNAYGVTTQELDFVWNSLRDEATFLRKESLDTANQKTNLYITAMNNEANTAINSTGVADGVKNLINEMFN